MASHRDAQGRQPIPPWLAVAALAAQRQGVLSLAELADAGVSARAAHRRAAAGYLHRLYDGVYAVGHPGVGVDGRRRAAVLASGRRAVLSHRSAGAAWGICADEPYVWHVTVPHGHHTAPGDIEPHQSRTMPREDATVLRAVPITTVARTLVDLAGMLPPDGLERALHDAEVGRMLDVGSVLEVAGRLRGRKGLGVLRRLLWASAAPTRSVLEARFARACRDAGLPLPALNAIVRVREHAYEVDALWRDARVVVELDGAAFHHTRRAFEVDRRRDAALMAAGFVVLRFTWRRVTEEARSVVGELHSVLALRGGITSRR